MAYAERRAIERIDTIQYMPHSLVTSHKFCYSAMSVLDLALRIIMCSFAKTSVVQLAKKPFTTILRYVLY